MKPNLKVVRLADIVSVMDFEKKKAEHLRQVINQSGSIRNPLYMASIGSKKYLLLEDSAILEAIRETGIEYVPGQIVKLRRRKKIDGAIMVEGLNLAHIENFQNLYPRAMTIQLTGNDNISIDKYLSAIFCSYESDKEIFLGFKRSSAGTISPMIFDFFDYLKAQGTFIEKVYASSSKTGTVKKPHAGGLLELYGINNEDLLFTARHNFLFPPGFLRYDYGMRLLGIDYPLSVLKERVSLREKNRFLHDLLDLRLNSGYSHFIRDGVYLLSY